jgi:hypothetical protein
VAGGCGVLVGQTGQTAYPFWGEQHGSELMLPALSPRVEAEVVARMVSKDRDVV